MLQKGAASSMLLERAMPEMVYLQKGHKVGGKNDERKSFGAVGRVARRR